MSCLSPAFWEAVFVWLVIFIAVIAIIRVFIMALAGGGSFWPVVYAPWSPPPGGASPGGIAGIVVAILNILIWAAIMIALIYFAFSLIGCLLSLAGGFPRLPR